MNTLQNSRYKLCRFLLYLCLQLRQHYLQFMILAATASCSSFALQFVVHLEIHRGSPSPPFPLRCWKSTDSFLNTKPFFDFSELFPIQFGQQVNQMHRIFDVHHIPQSLSWEIESNAYLESTKHMYTGCWCSRALCISILRNWESWFGLLSPFLVGIPPVHLQFLFQSSLGSFPVWSEEGSCLHVRQEQLFCNFARCLRSPFLACGMNVENVQSSGHSPHYQIATHIQCILSSTVSPALNSMLGPHQDVLLVMGVRQQVAKPKLCDLLSDDHYEQQHVPFG